ncbi:uncharacterized protein LOC118204366 [Stegodyphus dumicola]|uniref:uncharacterized protein LOC118204366 n=1 Tax=Stegodyphus dumicola TaxID=202533 RepID=UPI0015AA5667|nr:uncharacterized protein LOC118204366 [Stegodyphus dumicola]
MVIPRPGTNPTRRPCIKLMGRNLKITKTLKYLGVTWDQGLTWLPHLQEVKVRTTEHCKESQAVSGTKTGGRTLTFKKLLYLTVAERIVLYASAIWALPMSSRKIKALSAIQRPFALNISKAYRTTATNAALVCLPGSHPFTSGQVRSNI